MDSIEIKADIKVTPQLLAKLFWSLNSSQQVDFFNALADEIRQTFDNPANKPFNNCGPEGEGQWWYLSKELLPCGVTDPNEKGRGVLMAMAAPLYLTILREQFN